MRASNLAILVNLVGYLAGIGLYAVLLGVVLRDPANEAFRRGRTGPPPDRLPLGTAILGLLWNAGALWSYGQEALTKAEPPEVLMAASFTALGFLPAVVVHSGLRAGNGSRPGPVSRLLVALAYAVSTIAAVLQIIAAASGQPALTDASLRLLTAGFSVLTVAFFFVRKGMPDWRRAVPIVALAVFAVSALHLSHRSGHDTWTVELFGHHASLPLAVAILYQDYRFALIDIFLKRALSFVALVGCAFALYLVAGARLLEFHNGDGHIEPIALGALIGLWVALALAYPWLRAGVERFVDSVVLHRPDYDEVRAALAREIAKIESPDEVLDTVTRMIAPALTAAWVRWQAVDPAVAPNPAGPGDGRWLVIASEPPHYAIDVGPLAGGRRLLSDETALVDAVVLMAARRIDAVRVAHERCTANLREQEMSKLATEAELRALQAQLNPHFLFNALTTIGYLIQVSPERALDTLMRLTGLLRAVLKRSSGDFSTLGEEIDLVESYLSIERARFEERLRVRIDVEPALREARIPPLLIQPLVENAIKHGIAPSRTGGEVVITAGIRTGSPCGHHERRLWIRVADSGAGASEIEFARGRRQGVGLSNIRQRLECLYGSEGTLFIESSPGAGTRAEVTLPLATAVEVDIGAIESERRGA